MLEGQTCNCHAKVMVNTDVWATKHGLWTCVCDCEGLAAIEYDCVSHFIYSNVQCESTQSRFVEICWSAFYRYPNRPLILNVCWPSV